MILKQEMAALEREQEMNQVDTSYDEGKHEDKKNRKRRTQAAITMPQVRRRVPKARGGARQATPLVSVWTQVRKVIC